MTQNRPDHRASYIRLRAFVECAEKQATHSIGTWGFSPLPATKPCYTRDGGDIFLCASCFEFWRECATHGDTTTWEMATHLRDERIRDASVKTS